MAIAQSSSHNYIKETVYLDSMGTGITNVRYYNGLGYLTETASTCSGTSDNVYTYTTYDSKGRESTLYCPTPAGNTLDFQRLSAIRSASASFYRDNGAYTQNHYDHADRITREDIAGERWHSDNAHNSTEYGTNTQDDKVIIYNGTVNAEGFYPAGNLEKKTVTDTQSRFSLISSDRRSWREGSVATHIIYTTVWDSLPSFCRHCTRKATTWHSPSSTSTTGTDNS